ncbi:MAG: hypothetical protein JWP22_1568 [Ramlibacter sp.]|jgi:hypothetical protein|nr:hypothetical protein [Ramlibacter sp.]MDB5912893.1 hypothetical protein [Ramlibacter sp.]
MEKPEAVPLTAEENELIGLWLERPVQQRTLAQVPEYAQWLLKNRPALLPKWRDDACEYLVRVLADAIERDQGSSP